jgi:hypothetical protein
VEVRYMESVKGISNLLALLIIITIVVGVTVAGSGIIGNFLVNQRPEGEDLVLSGVTWFWEEDKDNGYVIYARGFVNNIGSDRINIDECLCVYQRD